ncbi:MAG: hypothetical protein COT81_02505 [Candidatus Buchananbacteria bacterium CG10_big_fil_rev_8_21_14_0_10_42_9]|uniref:Methyltransferase domain-containing protein n=1 Tax=Candidatus Buchananbacteria bacterium CG10_big_fil_rev_8_21_14_0_10_42_9 TaxID=1974526 RepID=A0A2H0W1H3_9BACT|nr:MAG: hypothetical protein COT81_02505 [Candidatus Buchananbacteria bacterium CG10_big_fil_rev_8_21_14_0_10_42_9]
MKKSVVKNILQQNKLAYEQVSDFFNDSRRFAWPEFSDFIEFVPTGAKILDLGCGNGRLLDALTDTKVNYTGLDISEPIIQAAKKRYPKAKFIVGDITNFSLPKKYDVIFLIASLHHIPSPELRLKVIQNAYHHLSGGGYIIMTNWNLRQGKYRRLYFASLLKKLLGQSELDWRGVWVPFSAHGDVVNRYYYGFSKSSVKRLLHLAGFTVVQNYYVRKGQKVGVWQGWNIVTVAKK